MADYAPYGARVGFVARLDLRLAGPCMLRTPTTARADAGLMHVPSTSSHAGTPSLEPSASGATCVLIVTVSARIAERLGGELSRGAYRPVVVHDGRQALRAAARLRPSLVVVEQVLPDMAAATLVRALRRLPRLGKLPAIVIGTPNPGDATPGLLARTLGRSVAPSELLETVEELLDVGSPRGRSGNLRAAAQDHQNGNSHRHQNGNGHHHENGSGHRHQNGNGHPLNDGANDALLRPGELERLERENHLLRERLADRSVELAFLAGFGIGISSGAGADRLMDQVLAQCAEVTGFECGAAYLAASHRPPVLQGQVGFRDSDRLRDFFGDPRLLAEAIAVAGDGIVSLPSDALDRQRSRAVLARARLRTLLVAPVLEAGELLGVLVLGSERASATAGQETLISTIAGQMGQWLSRVRNLSLVSRSERRTLERLARAAEFRDEETANHTQRVSRYSELLAGLSGVDQDRAELIAAASAMHDIGKLGIPDSILRKPGKLTVPERRHMQRHADYGRKILAGEPDPLLDLAAVIAWTHHERWDGGGYPRRLRGDDIPLEGRIVAIGDVFDALTSDRVYRPAMTVPHAVELMQAGSGQHFDPELLELFVSALPRVLEIRRRHPDDARTGTARPALA
jgi:response regulator RpfG family c-di-GMP phosphodiesterase